MKLERQPGQKEARYAHLLSGSVPVAPSAPHAETSEPSNLKDEVRRISDELAALRADFEEFKKQFG
jgi:uncharacterized protein YceH (UPF0502 family)